MLSSSLQMDSSIYIFYGYMTPYNLLLFDLQGEGDREYLVGMTCIIFPFLYFRSNITNI